MKRITLIALLIFSMIISLIACVEPSSPTSQDQSPAGSYSEETSHDSQSQISSDSSEEQSGIDKESDGSSDIAEESEDESSEKGSEEAALLTVTFDTDGGSDVESLTVRCGERIPKPEDPHKSTKDGEYEFIGWYYGDVEWIFDTDVVTESMTLTARWKKTESYTPPYLPKD